LDDFIILGELVALLHLERLLVEGLDVFYLRELLPEVPDLVEDDSKDGVALLLILADSHGLRFLHWLLV
jgi:hypothetical protein